MSLVTILQFTMCLTMNMEVAMDTSIQLDRRFAIIDEAVLNTPISDRALRLYAVLVRYADKDTHKAFPSRKTLSERLRCSLASVDRASTELVTAGLMTKQHRFNNSIVYTLVSSPMMTGVVTDDERVSSPVMRGVVTDDDLTRTIELEPKEREPITSEFDQFWSAYPKKADKALARRSFAKAMKKVSFDVIMDGVARYAADPNRDAQFTKNPSTWLNAESWENEPLPGKSRKVTNAEHAALLALNMERRQEQPRKEIEQSDFGDWLRGADDDGS